MGRSHQISHGLRYTKLIGEGIRKSFASFFCHPLKNDFLTFFELTFRDRTNITFIYIFYMRIKAFIFSCLLISCHTIMAQVRFVAGDLTIGFGKNGQLTEWKHSGNDYLYKDTVQPLMTLVSANKKIFPSSLSYNKSSRIITLQYAESGVSIHIKVTEKPSHLVMEVVKAIPENKIEAVIWGPYSNRISKTVGEVIGVVRDGETALGLQVLNIKTLGGDYPNNEGSTWARGIAARSFTGGSSIQAYSINRNRDRFVDAWGGTFKRMPVAALSGESVVGSKIALFACVEKETLNLLEKIELAEGLPHPSIKGQWFKRSEFFGKSYMISSFSESEVDEMLAYTKRSGLYSLYHEGPFKSWGHFVLDENQFPTGRAGLKKAADKAHQMGLLLGLHTLTNFINTNDPYVSPVPDDRLSVTGSSFLQRAIDENQTEIEVASPEYFNEQQNNSLHTVKIGKELIRYRAVSDTRPYKLLDCQRGAFNTQAAPHASGETVGKLFDHPYNVFFPNLEMQREVAQNLADLLNETGVDHIDFDGHEGGLAAGQGDYGVDLFAKDVMEKVKHEMVFGTSLSKTFYWHIGSYYNWGEPWYGGFKESMQQYRIDNQGLFDRNYMPHMLGWYLLTDKTTLSEMEWMLARAAGYSAGFAMVARPQSLRKNTLTPQLLDAIREWETARTSGAFSKEQQERLKNPKNEFHLEKISDKEWKLYQYAYSPLFTREKIERQPGEPVYTTWKFEQLWESQPLQFRISVNGKEGSVNNIKLQVDQYAEINIPLEMKAGETLSCEGGQTIFIYDVNGKLRQQYNLSKPIPVTGTGSHIILGDCSFSGDQPPTLSIQFKGLGKAESIQSTK